ncbi:MAG: site-specific DNA-methyltransferase [candidate division Zixibacteria bacterium]|nr:site-specific DNA-methyltransferase [candidate division Zixibacteria bacterium]
MKLMGGDFSDGELAWTSFNIPLRQFTYCNKYKGRIHPAQKPDKLFVWILQNHSNEGDTIFDPFMGSGATGVACQRLGRNFIGCEIDPEYCEIARRRIAEDQPLLNNLE